MSMNTFEGDHVSMYSRYFNRPGFEAKRRLRPGRPPALIFKKKQVDQIRVNKYELSSQGTLEW